MNLLRRFRVTILLCPGARCHRSNDEMAAEEADTRRQNRIRNSFRCNRRSSHSRIRYIQNSHFRSTHCSRKSYFEYKLCCCFVLQAYILFRQFRISLPYSYPFSLNPYIYKVFKDYKIAFLGIFILIFLNGNRLFKYQCR